MAELIREDDTLNQGRKKLNNAIKAFNETVVEGDSSVEAAQARVDEKGQTHSTLKDRIDDGFIKVNSQLADEAQQRQNEINRLDDKKADQSDLVLVEEKAENSIVTEERIPQNEISASRLKTTNQSDRIKLVNLHEEVVQAMAGNTPVNSIPADGSVTIEKLAPILQTIFIEEGADW